MLANLSKPNIVWDIKSKIFTKLNVFDDEFCDTLIEFGNEHVSKGINKYPHLFKTSFYSCLLPLEHEAHTKLQNVWEEIIDYYKFDINFVEPYELKKYTDNDFFGSHIDNYYGLNTNLDRKITLVVQLSNKSLYTGGELKVINTHALKERGSVTAFPSFFPHEVLKTTGCRWSLISWAWGPYWK